MTEEPPGPQVAAGDKPASARPAEPLKAEVSRTDAPGAGVSAAPAAPPDAAGSQRRRQPPAAAKPAAPAPPKPAAAAAAAAARGQAGRCGQAGGRRASTPKAGAADRPDRSAAARRRRSARVHRRAAGRRSRRRRRSSATRSATGRSSCRRRRCSRSARYLRDAPDAAFDFCSDVTATDWPPRAERFDVIYCLYSTRHRHRVRVKARSPTTKPVPSVDGDLAGGQLARARGLRHVRRRTSPAIPIARRILMPDDWQGYPAAQGLSARRPGRAADGEPARLAEAAPGAGRSGHRVMEPPTPRPFTARCSTPTSW